MTEDKSVEKQADEMDSRLAKALEGLNAAETLAMRTLMRGGSITAAAAAAGAARSTVYRWLEEGEPLAEAVRFWKSDLAGALRTRLLIMAELTTSSVAQAMREGDGRLALCLLKELGVLASPAVGIPTVEVKHRREIARAKLAESKLAQSELDQPEAEHFRNPAPVLPYKMG